MKKAQNRELNESSSLPVNIKEGKVRKQTKNIKKIKDKKQDFTRSFESKPEIDDHRKKINKPENKQKKIKSSPTTQDPQKKIQPKELSDTDLKKIEKRKVKNLAQKLRKKERKSKNKVLYGDQKLKEVIMETGITDSVKKFESTSIKIQAEEKKVHNEGTKTNTYDVKKFQEVSTDDAKKIVATSSKVLLKKEKKAERRKLIKDQKLAANKQNRNPAMEASTIFVGNLPVNTKRVQLIRLFKAFAPVNSIRLRTAGGQVLLKHKQRKKVGSLNAYIVLKDKETAEKALSLNGIEFKNHHLRITLAEKHPQSHEKEESKRTIFVGNLTYSATEESLREIFASCGEIDYIRCIRDGDKGCKGVAYVCFKTADGVVLGLELNGTIVDERPINVERFSIKKLGAKEARVALQEKEEKSKAGAKQRIDGKKGKKERFVHKKNSFSEVNHAIKPKKSEFRGVKIEGLKKKPKSKKKKSNDQMLQLAKKIAPKTK